jgi:hypothetical protein
MVFQIVSAVDFQVGFNFIWKIIKEVLIKSWIFKEGLLKYSEFIA